MADVWRSRSVPNYSPTYSPKDYQRDIVIHSVEKCKGDQIRSFDDFQREFNKKCFPLEARDRHECAYLELVQENEMVREYDEEFNHLKHYVGRELEEKQAQVWHFIRGLRLEICNHCLVHTFHSVSQLVIC